VLNMIENFGTGAFATVMDSYDYTAALNQVLPGKGLEKFCGCCYVDIGMRPVACCTVLARHTSSAVCDEVKRTSLTMPLWMRCRKLHMPCRM
jgi:hypothetical protein